MQVAKTMNLSFLAGGSRSPCKWEALESSSSCISRAGGYHRQELWQVKNWAYARNLKGERLVCVHQGCWVQDDPRTNWRVFSFTCLTFDLHIWVEKFKNLQADHNSLSPGKTHSVKVFGSHITTSRNPSTWKLEGRFSSHIRWKEQWLHLPSCLLSYDRWLLASEYLSTKLAKIFSGLLRMETLSPSTRGCRFSWEAETLRYHSRCQK